MLIDVRDGGTPAVEAALERPEASLSELAALAAAHARVSGALLALAKWLSGRPKSTSAT